MKEWRTNKVVEVSQGGNPLDFGYATPQSFRNPLDFGGGMGHVGKSKPFDFGGFGGGVRAVDIGGLARKRGRI